MLIPFVKMAAAGNDFIVIDNRRGALKKFGLGLAGIALAAMGLTNKAQAARGNCAQHCAHYCKKFPDDYYGCYSNCLDQCKHSPI